MALLCRLDLNSCGRSCTIRQISPGNASTTTTTTPPHHPAPAPPSRKSHSPLHPHCISAWARGSKFGLTTKNMFKYLRIITALFQEKDTLFFQQVCAEIRRPLGKTTIPHLNLLPQRANPASFMTDHSEYLLTNSLHSLPSLRFVLSEIDCKSMPTKSSL